MKKIFKYEVLILDQFSIAMPRSAHVLTVQVQNDSPCVWAIVDDERETRPMKFKLVGTGHPLEESDHGWAYVGTFQLYSGKFVGHLFVDSRGNP